MRPNPGLTSRFDRLTGAITGYDFLSNILTDLREWIEGNNDPDNPRTT